MEPRQRKLVLQQLDSNFAKLRECKIIPTPSRGWIRAIRDALGMSTTQLAARMGVHQPRISRIEQREVSGDITMKTMREAAEAMDCVFVYAVIPRTSLEGTIRAQAEKLARSILSRASHSMLLEDQALGNKQEDEMFEALVDNLVAAKPRGLWEIP
jgi:predicted DNA-binding mobile mystery protein A